MTRRIATDADLDHLVRLRLAFIADVRGWDPARLPVGYIEATRAFLANGTAAGTVTSWLDHGDGGSPVGVVSVLHRDVPPLPEDLHRKEGFIINLYVEPDARGCGRARALLDEVLASAPTLGITKFALHATDEAAHLYETSGFASDPTWMSRRDPRR